MLCNLKPANMKGACTLYYMYVYSSMVLEATLCCTCDRNNYRLTSCTCFLFTGVKSEAMLLAATSK